MKVRRVLEYDGPEDWVARTLDRSIGGQRAPSPYRIDAGSEVLTITEVSRQNPDRDVDLTRDDLYPGPIPAADVETCLRVLRTVSSTCLDKNRESEARAMSHAHAHLMSLTREAEEAERKEGANGTDAAGATPQGTGGAAAPLAAREAVEEDYTVVDPDVGTG